MSTPPPPYPPQRPTHPGGQGWQQDHGWQQDQGWQQHGHPGQQPPRRGRLGLAIGLALGAVLLLGLAGVALVGIDRGWFTSAQPAPPSVPTPTPPTTPTTPTTTNPSTTTTTTPSTSAGAPLGPSQNDVDGELDHLPVDQASAARSVTSQTPVRVTFANKGGADVTVSWVDFRGRVVRYKELTPGQSYQQQTYATHPWVVTDAGGSTLVFVIAGQNPGTVTIG